MKHDSLRVQVQMELQNAFVLLSQVKQMPLPPPSYHWIKLRNADKHVYLFIKLLIGY